MDVALPRRALAEAVGTALLLIAVVGSGIAAASLSPGDIGLQLFENAAATAGALVAIILTFGAVSGAHLNPVVTVATWLTGGLKPSEAASYVGAQVAGGACGTILANLMFELPAVEISTTDRASSGLLLAEVIATTGLLLVIFGTVRSGRSQTVAFAVGAYIGGAYFFTSSTSFANPAVTIARMLSDTFAGIAPASVPGFLGAQLVGLGLGLVLIRALFPAPPVQAIVAIAVDATDRPPSASVPDDRDTAPAAVASSDAAST